MTDQEILRRIEYASKLLQLYAEVIQPAADELARRKSLYVFGEENRYFGHLGCWDEGINTVCLHITDETYEKVDALRDKVSEKAYEFEQEWRNILYERKVKKISLSGFY